MKIINFLYPRKALESAKGLEVDMLVNMKGKVGNF